MYSSLRTLIQLPTGSVAGRATSAAPTDSIVCEIITEHGEIALSDLYAEYRDRADNPKSDRMIRNYLQKMERYNLVRAEGHNRGHTSHSVS